MKKTTLLIIVSQIMFSSCATIFGGRKYKAYVKVENNENAGIYYKGDFKGKGNAVFKVNRADANNLTILIKEDNCNEQLFNFSKREFRWEFLIINPWITTGFPIGIPIIPIGLGIDMLTGALWKPETYKTGVSQKSFKKFIYALNYIGCKTDSMQQHIKKDSLLINHENNASDYYTNANEIFLLQNYIGAMNDINKSINLDPNNSKSYNLRGVIKYKIKDYKGALNDYNKAIKLDKNNGEAFKNRGIYKLYFEMLDACDDFEKAAKLGVLAANDLLRKYCR